MALECRCKECMALEYTEEDIIKERKCIIDKIVRSITHHEFKKIEMYKDVYRFTKGVVLEYTKKSFVCTKVSIVTLMDWINDIEIGKIILVIKEYVTEKYGPSVLTIFEIVIHEFNASLIESIVGKMIGVIFNEFDRLSDSLYR